MKLMERTSQHVARDATKYLACSEQDGALVRFLDRMVYVKLGFFFSGTTSCCRFLLSMPFDRCISVHLTGLADMKLLDGHSVIAMMSTLLVVTL